MEPANPDLPPGVDWRMEIKTQPFNVFSAKKFPGLMESTQLSKTVADQGCRVRIRRDVRMRKRDGKAGAFERREDEYRRRTATPAPDDPHGIRARSQSNSSEHHGPYGVEPPRRTSAVDAYHAPPPPPPPGYDTATPPSRGCHLSFGDHPSAQYPTPRQYSVPSAAAYPPSQSPFAKPESNNYGYHHARNMSSTCPSPALSVKHDTYDRSSSGYVPPSPSIHSMVEGRHRRDSHASYPSLTPLLPHPPRQPGLNSSLAPLKIAALVSPLPPIEAQTEPLPAPPLIPTGGKRKHDAVFMQTLHPLHNGQRQHDGGYVHHRGVTPEPDQGMYSRADGKIGVVHFNQYR